MIPTELAIGHDGTIYLNAEDMDPARLRGRRVFEGVALRAAEVEVARGRALDGLAGYVLASDGRVYASPKLLDLCTAVRRTRFRGYALTRSESLTAIA